jgi:hypothetical protein
MPSARGCGSCDRCKGYQAGQARAVARQAAETQSIHEAKLAAFQRQAAARETAKAEKRARKARERLCAWTAPRGHIYEMSADKELRCVGCGRPPR